MSSPHRLSVNGLIMPGDFPIPPFEQVHKSLVAKVDTQGFYYREHAGAWNAVSYRFLAATDYGEDLTESIIRTKGSASVEARYHQEKALFGFFTNALSALEATLYGLFAIGGFLTPTLFPMTTAEDLQKITPWRTRTAYDKAFPADPIIKILDAFLADEAYEELKHIRNVLAHRSAPGRQIYLHAGDSEPLPEEWKLLDISLDAKLMGSRRAELARLLGTILEGTQVFVETRL